MLSLIIVADNVHEEAVAHCQSSQDLETIFLPPPLPRPSSELTATETRDSDTATLPYPTHASIQTTETSLGRGDWGLKRPLPLKSTTGSSTPIIRIDNIDSIDHITDFNSAADHVLTLRKWQELDMPISLVDKKKTASGNSLKPLRAYSSRDTTTPSSIAKPQAKI